MLADSLLQAVSKALPDVDPGDIAEVAEELIRQRAGDLIVGLSKTRKEVVRRVLNQGIARGWADSTIARRVAEVVGLDPRRALAVENFREGRLKAGVPPGRAQKMTEAYAKRLLMDRAKQIAGDEINLALRQAERLIWRDMQSNSDFSPYAVRVTRVTKDELTCPTCRPQNGKRRSLKATEGGPPFHPRCRCYEEVDDRGIEKQETVPYDEPYR